MKRTILAVLSVLALLSCSKAENNSDVVSIPGHISGYAQKGYLVEGSKVSAIGYGSDMKPTGESFSSTVTGCLGAFSIKVGEVRAAYFELKAEGYYFDEVTGDITDAPIALEAFIKEGELSANLNVFTTITKDRIKYLIKSGKAFEDARTQAQVEFFTTVNMAGAKIDFTKINLTGGSDADAMMLLTTCAIQYGRSAAQLSDIIRSAAAEFETTGTLTEKSSTTLFQPGIELNMLAVYKNLMDYYTKNGIPTSQLPSFDKYFGRGGATSQYLRICENLDFVRDSLVPYEGKSGKISINTNVDFRIISDNEWISVDSTKKVFEGVYDIFITVAPNDGNDEREGLLRFVDASKPYCGLLIHQSGHKIRLILDVSLLKEISWIESWSEYFHDLKPGALVLVNGTVCTVEDLGDIERRRFSVKAPVADSYVVSYPVGIVSWSSYRKVYATFPQKCFSIIPLACGTLNWRQGTVKMFPFSDMMRIDVQSVNDASVRENRKISRVTFSRDDGLAMAGTFGFNIYPGVEYEPIHLFQDGDIKEIELDNYDYRPYIELSLPSITTYFYDDSFTPPMRLYEGWHLTINFYDTSGRLFTTRTLGCLLNTGYVSSYSL